MFQLKRKSFFNYNIERFEDVVIKKQKTARVPKVQNYGAKLQQQRYNENENEISRTFEDNVDSFLEDEEDEREYESLFEGFPTDFETLPKRENKILKLLKFKNKRTDEPKISGENRSTTSNYRPDTTFTRPETTSHRQETTLHRPDTSYNRSEPRQNESENQEEEPEPEPEPVSCIPIIKLEPEDDLEPEVVASASPKEPPLPLYPKEQANNAANGSPAKTKKASSNTFAKLNPKFIGLEGSFLCTECPYETVYVTHFERHMKLDHPDMTLYKCEICQFETKSKSHLQVHTMNHLGIKPYKCTVCDYASARKDYVNMHMKCHTKDHTYFCPECTYSTYRADYLNRHITDKHLKAIF